MVLTIRPSLRYVVAISPSTNRQTSIMEKGGPARIEASMRRDWKPGSSSVALAVVARIQSGALIFAAVAARTKTIKVGTGILVLPMRNGTEIPSKPPFFHWLGLLSSQALGGVSELSVRLPSAVLGTIGTVATAFEILGQKPFGLIEGPASAASASLGDLRTSLSTVAESLRTNAVDVTDLGVRTGEIAASLTATRDRLASIEVRFAPVVSAIAIFVLLLVTWGDAQLGAQQKTRRAVTLLRDLLKRDSENRQIYDYVVLGFRPTGPVIHPQQSPTTPPR